MGEVQSVNKFEGMLRYHFQWALERAEKKVADSGTGALSNYNKELVLWFEYYQQNFEPKSNVPQKTIMGHLQGSRSHLRIGYRKNVGWDFTSIQRKTSLGKRFDTFGVLDHLPEEITLIQGENFLLCLATCLLNGYYGITHKGSLKESRTIMEFDARHLDLGSDLSNKYAAIRTDQLERLATRFMDFLKNEPTHYTDFILKTRQVNRVFLTLNLWRYGQLGILSHDNLNTWYCDEVMIPEIVEKASSLMEDSEKLLAFTPLHEAIETFLDKHKLYLNEVELDVWVNPASVSTPHSSARTEQAEEFLKKTFLRHLDRIHPKKPRI